MKFVTPPAPFFPTAPTARPAQPAIVFIPLTIVLISSYAFIFVLVYVQLVYIWYNKHKRFSFQTAFLFLSLFWSSIRITLFSFYFNNADDANKLVFSLYFILYCFPVVLQYCTLCLLVAYYGQVYFKIATRANRKKNTRTLRVWLLVSIVVFFVTSIVAAYYSRELCRLEKIKCNLFAVTLTRILINDSMFVVIGFMLSAFLFKLARLSMTYMIPEQDNISLAKAMLVSVCTSFLLISRTFYNLLAVTIDKINLPDFNFDWINVSDQADFVNLTETNKYISFVLVILIWELVPTLVVIILFKIKRANKSSNDVVTSSSVNGGSASGLSGAAAYANIRKSVFLDAPANNSDDLFGSVNNNNYNWETSGARQPLLESGNVNNYYSFDSQSIY